MNGPIYLKSSELAVLSIKFSEELNRRKKYELSNQLIRSATSVGANIREAYAGESRRDFYHKLKIAYKEILETEYWLETIKNGYDINPNTELLKKVGECKYLLIKIMQTTRKNGL